MEHFCKYLGINRTLSLICCTFWIFSPAEGHTISQVAGSKVILQCQSVSNNTLRQLTWKMNGATLFSFMPTKPLHISQEALNLNINMSERQPYDLVIERVQKSHTGNYTCETSMITTREENWELIITELEAKSSDMLMIAMAAIVLCVCGLIFILVLTILLRVCKRRAQDTTEMQEREEDIYENCLEIDLSQRRGYNQPHHYKPTA